MCAVKKKSQNLLVLVSCFLTITLLLIVLTPSVAVAISSIRYWGKCPAGGLCRVWPFGKLTDIFIEPSLDPEGLFEDRLITVLVRPRNLTVDSVYLFVDGSLMHIESTVNEQHKVLLTEKLIHLGLFDSTTHELLFFRTTAPIRAQTDSCGRMEISLNGGLIVPGVLPGMVVREADLDVDNSSVKNAAHIVDDLNIAQSPIGDCAIGGSVRGITPREVACENKTTGQVVTLQTNDPSWDCEVMGLQVIPGDSILMSIDGGLPPPRNTCALAGGNCTAAGACFGTNLGMLEDCTGNNICCLRGGGGGK